MRWWLDKIQRLEALGSGGHQLILEGLSQPIPVSRRQLAEIKQVYQRAMQVWRCQLSTRLV